MSKRCYQVILIALLVVVFISQIFGGAVIIDFKGIASRNQITIKFSTMSEVNCKEFVIERSLDKKTYDKIANLEASGNSNLKKDYEYIDRSVFRATDNTFYYRIKIVDKNGSESLYSETIAVTASVSGVRHTWGSIKAMFR
ncbi:hypothetical protein JXB12_12010 [candidate division KSB1 bacterium]|nr:hypothetical protein [candidate division KSB1 bacterium]